MSQRISSGLCKGLGDTRLGPDVAAARAKPRSAKPQCGNPAPLASLPAAYCLLGAASPHSTPWLAWMVFHGVFCNFRPGGGAILVCLAPSTAAETGQPAIRPAVCRLLPAALRSLHPNWLGLPRVF